MLPSENEDLCTIYSQKIFTLQSKCGYRTNSDTTTLAANVTKYEKDPTTLVDLCCGVGTISIASALFYSKIHIYQLDFQKDILQKALRNSMINGISNRTHIALYDISYPLSEIISFLPNHIDIIVFFYKYYILDIKSSIFIIQNNKRKYSNTFKY